jgi:hypothetical protein
MANLFDKLVKSWNEQDVQTYRSCFHEDWQFTFHSSGKVITRADDSPKEEMKEFMKNMKRENPRCLYENDDILVVHDFITFASGDREAVMMVHLKKDGLLWRTESGATTLKTTN